MEGGQSSGNSCDGVVITRGGTVRLVAPFRATDNEEYGIRFDDVHSCLDECLEIEGDIRLLVRKFAFYFFRDIIITTDSNVSNRTMGVVPKMTLEMTLDLHMHPMDLRNPVRVSWRGTGKGNHSRVTESDSDTIQVTMEPRGGVWVEMSSSITSGRSG